MGAKFGLSDFASVSLLQAGKYKVIDSKLEVFDFSKKDGTGGGAPRICLALVFKSKDDADAKLQKQYYSVVSPTDKEGNTVWKITNKGKMVEPVGKSRQLPKGSNFFVFLENAVKAGFPEDKLSDDFTIWAGIEGDMEPVQPEQIQNAVATMTGQQAEIKRGTVFVFTDIDPKSIKNSGKVTPYEPEDVLGGGAAAPKGKTAAEADDDEEEDSEEETEETEEDAEEETEDEDEASDDLAGQVAVKIKGLLKKEPKMSQTNMRVKLASMYADDKKVKDRVLVMVKDPVQLKKVAKLAGAKINGVNIEAA